MIAVKILMVAGLFIIGPDLCQPMKHNPPTSSPSTRHTSVETRTRYPSPDQRTHEHSLSPPTQLSSSSLTGDGTNHKTSKGSHVMHTDNHNLHKVLLPRNGAVPKHEIEPGLESPRKGSVSPEKRPLLSTGRTASTTGRKPRKHWLGSITTGFTVGKSMRTNRKSKEWWERSRSSSLSSDLSSLDLPTEADLAASKEEKPSSPKSEAEKPLLSKESPERLANAETPSTEPAKKRPGKSVRTRNSKEYWDKASISSLSSDSSSFSSFSSEPSSPKESSKPSSPKKKEELSEQAKCNLKCLNKDGWVDGGEEFENAQIPVKEGYLVEEDGVPTCKCKISNQFMFFLGGKGVNANTYKGLEEKDPISAREWLEQRGVKINLIHTQRQMSRSPPVKRADLPPALRKELEEEESKIKLQASSKNEPESSSKNEPKSPSKNKPGSAYRSPDNCTDKCQMDFAFIKLNETELKANDIPYPGIYITVPVDASASVPDCTCKINPRLLNYLRVKGHNETEFVEAHGLHNEHPWTGRVWLGTKPRGFRVLFHDAPERVKDPGTPEKATVTAAATPEKETVTAPAKPEKGPASISAATGKKGT